MDSVGIENLTATRATLPVYLCPSDTSTAGAPFGASNYHLSLGTGTVPGGSDVAINPGDLLEPDGMIGSRAVRVADIVDGLANTAAMSEMAHGVGLDRAERSSMSMPAKGITFGFSVTPTTQAKAMADCENVLTLPPPLVKEPSGVPWVKLYGYTHLFGPNKPSCFVGNLGDTVSPITASSRHGDGVNVLLADGHATFVHSKIDLAVWRAIGSRSGGEAEEIRF